MRKVEFDLIIFHKIIWYTIIPVIFITQVYNFIYLVQNLPAYCNFPDTLWVAYSDISLSFVIAATCLITFIGFFKNKPYAWYGVIMIFPLFILWNFLGFMSIYELANICPDIPVSLDNISIIVGRLIFSLIFTNLVIVYYIHLRPLFFPNAKEA